MGVPVTVTALFCSYHIQALCRTLDANDPFIFLTALGNGFCSHFHLKLGEQGKEILSKLSRITQIQKYDLNSGLSISKARASYTQNCPTSSQGCASEAVKRFPKRNVRNCRETLS